MLKVYFLRYFGVSFRFNWTHRPTSKQPHRLCPYWGILWLKIWNVPMYCCRKEDPTEIAVTSMYKFGLAKFLSASKDVITITIDARGTVGKGAAYQNSIFSNLGQVDVEDVINVARYVTTNTRFSIIQILRIIQWRASSWVGSWCNKMQFVMKGWQTNLSEIHKTSPTTFDGGTPRSPIIGQVS